MLRAAGGPDQCPSVWHLSAHMPTRPAPAPREHRLLIIGSGFAGIAMAVALRRRGHEDFVILERASALGGTWRDNRYPGCACDVESALYSLSFAPNPDWSHTFARQPEIEAYLVRVATEHGIVPFIRFDEEVTGAVWDSAAERWVVTSTSGTWRAQSVVMANGALSDPIVPDLPGLSTFAGPAFHTARWDARVSVEGKRVAVIGTGASAIQVIPAIQPQVRHLVVAQRTPAWVLPRWDHEVPAWRRGLYRDFPLLHRLVRGLQYVEHELLLHPFRHAGIRRLMERVIGLHLARQVRDPALRAALTPHYGIGCKRLLLSNDYYPALTQPNVTLVPHGVARVEHDGIITSDGAKHLADILVLATGFRVTDPILAPVIVGRDGRSLARAWAGSPKAYMGTTVAGFPNLFMLMGPNTGLGHSSVLMIAEAQVAHVMGALALLARRGARAIEPRAEAQARFVREMDAGLAETVWMQGGCTSWYLDRTGRNAALWPYGLGRFRRTVGRVRAEDYVTTPG